MVDDPVRAVLLVEDAAVRAREIETILATDGMAVTRVASHREARVALEREAFDVILLGDDLWATDKESFIEALVSGWPDVPVIVVVTAVDDEAQRNAAADAMSAGAADYLRLELGPPELLFVVKKVIAAGIVLRQQPPRNRARADEATAMSPAMREVLEMVERAAPGMATILIRGESGVGKELVAHRIHALGARPAGPFVKVHCAGLPETILESELFGYEKGAFTGAVARKAGRVELAEGGTLFLDEIGDISPTVQVKLLRILQDRAYERLGGTQTLRADVRFVAATHRNLERMMKHGEFREDLYYRLNVVRIDVPPLRARPEDLEPLIHKFAEGFAAENGRIVALAPQAVALLKQQRWPGNVRQLQNFIERAVVLSEAQVIDEAEVRSALEREAGALAASDTVSEVSVIELGAVVRQAERRALERALKKANGDRTLAARLLGISRRTLFYKLSEHGLGSTRA